MLRATAPAVVPQGIPIRKTPLQPMVSETSDGAGFNFDGDPVGVRGTTTITRTRASPGKQVVPLSPLNLPLLISPPPYTDFASARQSPFLGVYLFLSSIVYHFIFPFLSWTQHEVDVRINISSAHRDYELQPLSDEDAGGKGKGRSELNELDFAGSVPVVPDILDTLNEKDFEYAIQLQIEELQRVTHEFEDEKMARRLAGESVIQEPSSSTPRYNLRPRPITSNSIKKKTTKS